MHRYRSIVDRVLEMRLVYIQKRMNRAVDFEFLNRQVIWETFTVSILFPFF